VKTKLWIIRLWVTQTPTHRDSKGPISLVTFVFLWEGSLSVVQFVFFWITCLAKFKDKMNETDNSTCNNRFRMSLPTTLTISGNIPMTIIWSFTTTLNALTPLQRLSNPCQYKELKTWRITTRLYSFNCALTMSN